MTYFINPVKNVFPASFTKRFKLDQIFLIEPMPLLEKKPLQNLLTQDEQYIDPLCMLLANYVEYQLHNNFRPDFLNNHETTILGCGEESAQQIYDSMRDNLGNTEIAEIAIKFFASTQKSNLVSVFFEDLVHISTHQGFDVDGWQFGRFVALTASARQQLPALTDLMQVQLNAYLRNVSDERLKKESDSDYLSSTADLHLMFTDFLATDINLEGEEAAFQSTNQQKQQQAKLIRKINKRNALRVN